ncbi:ABC transporter ATP-binding protein [Kaistia algarum]|nr:ABC transporter ATP-binding protein [Kaistia algarum]
MCRDRRARNIGQPIVSQPYRDASFAVEVENVELSLGSGAARVHILKGVSLQVASGTSLALVGPSGSGKSTLLMVMAGLERIDAGRLVVAGEDLSGADEDRLARFRRRNVGIVFQSFHLIPNMTALENVAVPLELSGVRDAFERAEAELKLVGLGARLHHYPGALSGGEQQRVAIARALVAQPAIVFADEPTGNLDEANGRQIAELLFTSAAARGATLILVTHDPALAGRCEQTVRVHSGRLEEPQVRSAAARSAAE